MASLITDEMLEVFAVEAPYDELGRGARGAADAAFSTASPASVRDRNRRNSSGGAGARFAEALGGRL